MENGFKEYFRCMQNDRTSISQVSVLVKIEWKAGRKEKVER